MWLSVVLIILVTACDESTQKAKSKPSSAGTTLEMVVVADNQTWNSSAGTKVKEFFGQEAPGLGQVEPVFDVRHIEFNAFSELFQKHRNLLILEINQEKNAKSIYKANVWAQPQFVVKLVASDLKELNQLLRKEQENIMQVFKMAERKRIINAYSRMNQRDLAVRIKEKMNISMVVPSGFYIAKLEDDFLWLRREPSDMSQGIMVYTKPYKDTAQFYPDNIIRWRDSITKKHIPGPIKKSYMATEDILTPVTSHVKFNKNFAVEIRGLWRTENYFMGGPFINITTFDEKNNRLVSMDGFVYRANKAKRNYLMQLEGIIHSIDFIDEEEEKENTQAATTEGK